MKKIKVLIAVMLVFALALAVCACSVELGGEETWNYTAEDWEGSRELFNNFTEKTFSDTNQIVTMSNNGKELFTETIDGTSEYGFAENGSESYAFKDGDKYFYAVSGDGSKYYMEGEDNYDLGYRMYKRYFYFLEKPEDESAISYSCKVEGKSDDGKSSETYELVMDAGKNGKATVKAASEDGLVTSITFTSDEADASQNVDMKFTFTYGSAKVETPDLSGWEKIDINGSKTTE